MFYSKRNLLTIFNNQRINQVLIYKKNFLIHVLSYMEKEEIKCNNIMKQ